MTTIGLVGAGYMGAALGVTLRGGGHEVLTTLAGRSSRTARIVAEANIATVPDLETLVERADLLLVVTPPTAAIDAARAVASASRHGGASPLVVDLNAVSPSTMELIAAVLADARLDLVDGSISGSPPTVADDTLIYLAGPRAADVARLQWHPARPVIVGKAIGTASAVKMCTGSVYKGLTGLLAQALRTAQHHGVVDHVLADLADLGGPPAHFRVAMAATKAERFVGEMLQIAETQASAGLSGDLFQAYARIYEDLARSPLAAADPETLDRAMSPADVVSRLTLA